jgi:hypothetical protein
MTSIICGPVDDNRIINIELSSIPETIGVFVSGGLDSAILYYLIIEENLKLGNIHTILPLTVARKEGSKYFSRAVVDYVHQYFNLPKANILNVGDNTVYEPYQVTTGINDAVNIGCDKVFLGLITQLPEHTVGWVRPSFRETPFFRAPFLHAKKSHIVDIISKVNQEGIFYITHSCDYELGRCNVCNGCNERSWGFETMNLVDPGII